MVTRSLMPSTATGAARRRGDRRTFALRACAATLSLAIGLPALAQEAVSPPPVPPALPTRAGPADDFGRGTPRGAIQGFLETSRAGDFERAAAYLDLRRIPTARRKSEGPSLARHLAVVLERALWVDPELLSDTAEGDRDDGLPARQDLVGTIATSQGPVPVLLERAPRDDGTLVWRVAPTTVAQVPALYEDLGYGPFGEWLPAPFFEIRFLHIQLWQWIGLAALLLAAYLGSWMIDALAARLVRLLAARARANGDHALHQALAGPLRLAVAATFFYAGSFALKPSLPVQAFFSGVTGAVVIVALTWLGLRLVDLLAERLQGRWFAGGRAQAAAVVPVGRRLTRVLLTALALTAMLHNVGVNVTGVLAGLGIAGLAVALAAQETVKNFFGGIALIADQPVRVGDLCRFGDKVGTVEDISLWSTRVRTPDRTLISLPNSQFSNMQLENFAKRDRFMLRTTLSLRGQTTSAALRQLLGEITAALQAHARTDRASAYARLVGIGQGSFNIDVCAYVITADPNEFLAIQEEILLRIMDVVAANGGQLRPA